MYVYATKPHTHAVSAGGGFPPEAADFSGTSSLELDDTDGIDGDASPPVFSTDPVRIAGSESGNTKLPAKPDASSIKSPNLPFSLLRSDSSSG